MQLRTLITVKALPIWFLVALILLTLSDLLSQLGSAISPPGLLGTIPVLVIAAFGMFFRERRNDLTAPLLLLCGIATCWISTVLFSEGRTAISLMSLAMIGLTLVCSVCLILVMLPGKNTAEAIPKVSGQREQQSLLAETESLDHFLIAKLAGDESSVVELETDDQSEGETLQTWTRVRLCDQSERLEGTVRLHFRAGERIQHCHIPISPAFSTIPEGWSECDDDSFRSELTTRQTYGVRLTVKRSMQDLAEGTVNVSVLLLGKVENCSAA